MTDSASPKLYRLALTYRLEHDGLLVAERLPAEKVPVRGEGTLYRRMANLADADDRALVVAASRYGPLGPTNRLAVADQPSYLWAVDGAVRRNVSDLRLLRKWLAYGGTTPIPGRVAPVAHLLAVIAEADEDWILGRILELLSEGPPPTEAERASFGRSVDRLEHRLYAGIGRRAAQINTHLARGDHHVKVNVQPDARRRLTAAAAHWRQIIDGAFEGGRLASLIPPGSLGRIATELRPYFSEGVLPLYPVESTTEWRAACRELAGWVLELARPEASSTEGRASLKALLLLRLQHVDAWPFPTGELLGAFPRALWSLWQPITGRRPERRCTWPDCTHLLPADAHGNRYLCDDHRHEALRLRSARNRRKRAQQSASGAH